MASIQESIDVQVPVSTAVEGADGVLEQPAIASTRIKTASRIQIAVYSHDRRRHLNRAESAYRACPTRPRAKSCPAAR